MIAVKRPAIALVAVAITVVLLAIVTNVVPFRHVVDQRTEIKQARDQLAMLVSENATLTQQVGALETPIEIERIAREKLGFVRPGETAFVVIAPEPEAKLPVASVSIETAADAAEANWFEKLWAYLTGADLVSE